MAGRSARLHRFGAILELYRASHSLPPTTVKITGTSGKGSVAAMLGSALESCGTRTGVFTSPHLIDPIERIRIGNRTIDERELQAAFEEMSPFLDAIPSKLGGAYRPSFFEALLIVALRSFQRSAVEVAILESAVGGYNDVVSLIPSRLSIITSVGLDHGWNLVLGLPMLQKTKLVLLHRDQHWCLGPNMDAEAVAIISQEADARGVSVRVASLDRIEAVSSTADGSDVRIRIEEGLIEFRCPLRGAFQLRNLATVLAAVEELHEMRVINDVGCVRGVSQTVWPGRLETFDGPVTWLLDAAHNVMSFEAVADFIRTFFPTRAKVLAFGASDHSKAVDGLRVLSPPFDRTLLVNGFYKSFDMGPVASVGESVFSSPAELVHTASTDPKFRGILVVVTGSVYLVGACRLCLLEYGYQPGRLGMRQ